MDDESFVCATAFGRMTVRPSPAGDNLRCPDDVDQALASYANNATPLNGVLLVQPGAYVLLKNCYREMTAGVAAFSCSRCADRDEWKRMAERAEKDLVAALDDRAELVAELEQRKKGKRSLLRDFCESGTGIRRLRPDNSVAWLDEDLLCEDA